MPNSEVQEVSASNDITSGQKWWVSLVLGFMFVIFTFPVVFMAGKNMTSIKWLTIMYISLAIMFILTVRAVISL